MWLRLLPSTPRADILCESSDKDLTRGNSWVDVNHDTSDFGCIRRLAIAAETAPSVSTPRDESPDRLHPVPHQQPASRAGFPFTTLEEWLFWEDRPAYPWSCFIRLRFTGQLDRVAFEEAVHRVLKRHPLFCATARIRGRTHLQWIPVDDPQPPITWASGPVGGSFPAAAPLDLFREIGIRFHIVSDGRACDLVIQFHHACCDGVGMVAVADELLIAYALALGGAPDGLRLPTLDPSRFAARGRFGLTAGRLMRMLPRQLVGLHGAGKFLLRNPVPIIPCQSHADETLAPPQYPAVLGGVLEPAELLRLREAARRYEVRLNDLLVRELFLAVAQWRARQSIPDDNDWLRMMIPVNMRSPDDDRLAAVSLASFVVLDRRSRDFADPGRLLRGIHDEMSLILRLQLGFTFVFCSGLLNLIPGRLKARVRAPHCMASCVLSNVGRLFVQSPLPRSDGRVVAGNVILESVDIVAPIRPYTCASFVAITYAGRLAITLHYDPRPLTGPQAADLLDTFLTRLRAVQS